VPVDPSKRHNEESKELAVDVHAKLVFQCCRFFVGGQQNAAKLEAVIKLKVLAIHAWYGRNGKQPMFFIQGKDGTQG
jgi:hypothetical protein